MRCNRPMVALMVQRFLLLLLLLLSVRGLIARRQSKSKSKKQEQEPTQEQDPRRLAPPDSRGMWSCQMS
jgi:hypothetical protein